MATPADSGPSIAERRSAMLERIRAKERASTAVDDNAETSGAFATPTLAQMGICECAAYTCTCGRAASYGESWDSTGSESPVMRDFEGESHRGLREPCVTESGGRPPAMSACPSGGDIPVSKGIDTPGTLCYLCTIPLLVSPADDDNLVSKGSDTPGTLCYRCAFPQTGSRLCSNGSERSSRRLAWHRSLPLSPKWEYASVRRTLAPAVGLPPTVRLGTPRPVSRLSCVNLRGRVTAGHGNLVLPAPTDGPRDVRQPEWRRHPSE